MAFNLLNTVLNSKNTASSALDAYRGLDVNSLSGLAATGNTDALAALRAGALPTGLPSGSTSLATAAGLTTTDQPGATGSVTSPTTDATGDDIVVTGERASDNRLRISALAGRAVDVYGANDKSSNIMAPLHATGGLMFPYTPAISVSGDTDWTPHSLTHTNYDIYSYQRTPSASITLSGKFTVQNQREGEYALACIHFLRTMGKMYYGEQDSADYDPKANDQTKSNAGLPPPVLRLRGYGQYMFSDLHCVLKNYSFTFEENMDLVTIQAAGGDVMLPPLFTLNITVLLQQNPTRLRQNFKLDDFRTGALMRQSGGGGWF